MKLLYPSFTIEEQVPAIHWITDKDLSLVPTTWVEDLVAGDVVWMVKEKAFALIAGPYERYPTRMGQLKLITSLEPYKEAMWSIDSSGYGFDSSLLIQYMPGWRAPLEPTKITLSSKRTRAL